MWLHLPLSTASVPLASIVWKDQVRPQNTLVLPELIDQTIKVPLSAIAVLVPLVVTVLWHLTSLCCVQGGIIVLQALLNLSLVCPLHMATSLD